MRKLAIALLSVAVLAGAPALADPNPQLVASVENRLAHYGLSADVSQFATSTVVQLHFALSSRESYFQTKQTLRSILRNAKYQ